MEQHTQIELVPHNDGIQHIPLITTTFSAEEPLERHSWKSTSKRRSNMRPRSEMSPERPRIGRSSSMKRISPSTSYSDTTEAMMEPISPKSAPRRSLGMDEATYNLLFLGKIGEDIDSPPKQATEQIGSCPYCRLGGSVEHNCSSNAHHRNQLFHTPRLSDPTSGESRKEGEEKSEETSSSLQTVVVAGVTYFLDQILAEGWLQKKGTGQDWLGSRGWKARWARLCMARRVESSHSEGLTPSKTGESHPQVPLLLLYWFPASTTVSTAIALDSTVVMGVDLDDKNRVNPFRFEVRHATTQDNATLPTITRTFAAPQRARDAWVYAISQALLTHAKAKDKAKKIAIACPRISPRGVVPSLEEEHPWNRGVSLTDRLEKTSMAPLPLSPTQDRPVRPSSPLSTISSTARAERRAPRRRSPLPHQRMNSASI